MQKIKIDVNTFLDAIKKFDETNQFEIVKQILKNGITANYKNTNIDLILDSSRGICYLDIHYHYNSFLTHLQKSGEKWYIVYIAIPEEEGEIVEIINELNELKGSKK